MSFADIAALQRQKKEIEAALSKKLNDLKIKPGVSVVASQLLLSHQGRIAEANEDPGCCGVTGLEAHLIQCADPDSWVHVSLDNWVKKALEKIK